MSVLIAAPLMYLGAREIEASRSMSLTEKSDANGYSRAFMKQPEFWFLGLAFACGALLQQITINHLLAIMADRNVVRDISILAASFIGPMQVAGRIAIVVAGSRASNHLVAIFSFLAMGASIVTLSMVQSGFGFIVAFTVLFGAAHGVVSVVRPGLTWDILGGENIGAKMGFLAAMFFLGGAVAPLTGSLIWKAGGYDTVLVTLVFLAILGLCLYLAAHRNAKLSAE